MNFGSGIHIGLILTSSLLLFSLGVVCLVSSRKERIWKALAVFSFILMASSVAALTAFSSRNHDIGLLFARLAIFFTFISILVASRYTEILAGQRLKHNWVRWNLSPRAYLSISLLLALVILVILLTSKMLFTVVEIYPTGEFSISYGPLMYLFVAVLMIGILKMSYSIALALRASRDRAYKEFLILNILALHAAYLPAILLNVLQPKLGFSIDIYIFMAFPTAVTILYIAVLRYQFSRVHELTTGLERKVAERTMELKAAQAQLTQRDKMASLGLMVASIAHEINNPIGAIRGMQGSLKSASKKLRDNVNKLNDDDTAQSKLQASLNTIDGACSVIDSGSEKIAYFVNRLKSFVNLDQANLQMVDVHEGLDSAVMLVRPLIRSNIRIIKEYGTLPRIRCNPSHLNQAFLNILVNAVQAIPETGNIRIITGTDKSNIVISISDTGKGIPEDDFEYLFDPGFTTKSTEKGIGLGLTIANHIIQAHSGSIRIRSEVGKGATFEIVLPTDYLVNMQEDQQHSEPESGDVDTIEHHEIGERL